ncbi:sensor histidine kinase [Nocardioides sp. C4-1]|uniref:sensor histidine kinase n=1 Tax=Nocardioides sp. C4-1 TaxID=3151851 RepID=UPI003263E873
MPTGLDGIRVVGAMAGVAVPVLTAVQFEPGGLDPARLWPVVGLTAYRLILIAALLVYLHWWMTRAAVAGWISVALAVSAIHGLTVSGIQLLDEDLRGQHSPAQRLLDALVCGVVLVLARLAESRRRSPEPLALIAIAGLVTVSLDVVLLGVLPPFPTNGFTQGILVAAVVVVALAIAATVLRLGALPPWAGRRLAIAVLIFGTTQLGYGEGGRLGDWFSLAALTALVLGTLLAVDTALKLLGETIAADQHAFAFLGQRADDHERGRDQLHQVRSGLAGLAAGAQMLLEREQARGRSGADADDDRELCLVMLGEIERLRRVVGSGRAAAPRTDDTTWAPDAVDTDLRDVLGRLVGAQALQGRDVRLVTTCPLARGDWGQVGEVVEILLDNAARHGHGAGVTVSVREAAPGRRGDGLEIVVADRGPGIAPEVAGDLFGRGVKGPDSQGEGIGLEIASRLAGDLGGSLRVASTGPRGTEFVLTITGGAATVARGG